MGRVLARGSSRWLDREPDALNLLSIVASASCPTTSRRQDNPSCEEAGFTDDLAHWIRGSCIRPALESQARGRGLAATRWSDSLAPARAYESAKRRRCAAIEAHGGPRSRRVATDGPSQGRSTVMTAGRPGCECVEMRSEPGIYAAETDDRSCLARHAYQMRGKSL
jgi:hypothetical protein